MAVTIFYVVQIFITIVIMHILVRIFDCIPGCHLDLSRGETVEDENEEEEVVEVKDEDGDVSSYQEMSKAAIVSGEVKSGRQVQVKEASGEVYPAKVIFIPGPCSFLLAPFSLLLIPCSLTLSSILLFRC